MLIATIGFLPVSAISTLLAYVVVSQGRALSDLAFFSPYAVITALAGLVFFMPLLPMIALVLINRLSLRRAIVLASGYALVLFLVSVGFAHLDASGIAALLPVFLIWVCPQIAAMAFIGRALRPRRKS